MALINHYASFLQNQFTNSRADGTYPIQQWCRNLSASEAPIKSKDPEKEFDYNELLQLTPEKRLSMLGLHLGFILGRVQSEHLNWIKNVAKTMNRAFSTPRYRHSQYTFRVNSLLKRLSTGPGMLTCIAELIFMGVFCARNSKVKQADMDLFLDAYSHHKLEISVERKWLFQVLAPLVVLNRLSAMYMEGAHCLVAATVGFAVGDEYKDIDKMAKTKPDELYRLAKEKIEEVETFIYSVSKKMNAWANYVQNDPKLDNNFINAAYSDWEKLTGIYAYLNTQYSKERIQDALSFFARDAEDRTVDTQNHWQGIQNCLKEAKKRYPMSKITFAAEKIANSIQKAQNDLCIDMSSMRAMSHIIQLYRLTGFENEDAIWNEQNGIVYHYKEANKYLKNSSELLPSWTELCNIWMMRMPDAAQKALQKHGRFFPNKPI